MARRTLTTSIALALAGSIAAGDLVVGCTASRKPSAAAPTTKSTVAAGKSSGWGPSVSVDRLDRELEELRAVDELGDDESTIARFGPLVPKFLSRCEPDDLRRMLRDPERFIRAMALVCLAYEPANDLSELTPSLKFVAADETRLPPGLVPINPPLSDDADDGPTIAQITAIVRSGEARRRFPSLPILRNGNDVTAQDCARLIRCCRRAVDPAGSGHPATTSAAASDDDDGGDSQAWISASEALTAHADRIVLDQMLRDPSPVSRAAALAATARCGASDAIDVLSLALNDDGAVWPGGGTAGGQLTMTVGDLSARLLTDARFLSFAVVGTDHSPLTDDARRTLILRMLADNAPVSRLQTLRTSFAAEMNTTDRTAVEALLTLVTQRDATTIKALGRGAYENELGEDLISAVRTFLIACLDDATLPADARFAAGSALTRDPSSSSQSALSAVAAELNALSPDTRAGDRFVAEAKLREQIEAASTTTPPPTSLPEAATQAVDSPILVPHPMVLPLLRKSESERIERDEVFRSAVVETIERVADRLDAFHATWDTYSNAGFELEALLKTAGPELTKQIGSETMRRLIAHARAAEQFTISPSSSTTRP